MKYFYHFLALSLAGLLLVSCLNDPNPPEQRDQLLLTLNLSNVNEEIGTETDTLSISSLRFLVGNISIKNESGDTLIVSQTPFQVTHPSQNPSQEVKGLISGSFTSEIVYNSLDFEIKKAEAADIINASIDDAFVEGDSDSQRYSMIIQGDYNGQTFEFKSTRNFTFEFDIDDQSDGSAGALIYNLNMTTEIGDWFQNPESPVPDLIDPSEPANASIINDNIEGAIRLN